MTVTRFYRFEAAHFLEGKQYGASEGTHGHSYRVAVQLPDGTPTESLDLSWDDLIRPLVDHRLLNDSFSDTTVEGLAGSIWSDLNDAGCPVLTVTVREGEQREATTP